VPLAFQFADRLVVAVTPLWLTPMVVCRWRDWSRTGVDWGIGDGGTVGTEELSEVNGDVLRVPY
jgi:hypothetical protein